LLYFNKFFQIKVTSLISIKTLDVEEIQHLIFYTIMPMLKLK